MAAVASGQSGGNETTKFLTGLARGLAGALLFALPMLMTMEMWFSASTSIARGFCCFAFSTCLC